MKGPLFEYCYVRDDRVHSNDETSKHVNQHYRIVGYDISGQLVQGSFVCSENHFRVTTSTEMPSIESLANIKSMPDYGPISEAIKRGLLLDLCDIRKNLFE